MEKIIAKRPESLATFQIEIQNFLQRMQNRLKVLRNEVSKWQNGYKIFFGRKESKTMPISRLSKEKSLACGLFIETGGRKLV
jgi:hypothetical protein